MWPLSYLNLTKYPLDTWKVKAVQKLTPIQANTETQIRSTALERLSNLKYCSKMKKIKRSLLCFNGVSNTMYIYSLKTLQECSVFICRSYNHDNHLSITCTNIHVVIRIQIIRASFWENRTFAYAKTKPQISVVVCGNRKTDQRLCFRYMDSTIHLLPKAEISSV